MAKWTMNRNAAGKPVAWEVHNPSRLDIVSFNDKAAKRRGGSKVIVKGERVIPSPDWLAMHNLPTGSSEVRSYHFRYGSVDIAVNKHFLSGSPVEDIINYLAQDPNGWKSIETIWWEY